MRKTRPEQINPAQQAISNTAQQLIHLLYKIPADEPLLTDREDLHKSYLGLLYPINGTVLADRLTAAILTQQHATESQNLDFHESWYGLVETSNTLTLDWFRYLYPQEFTLTASQEVAYLRTQYRKILNEDSNCAGIFGIAKYLTMGMQHLPMAEHPADKTFDKFTRWLDNYVYALQHLPG